MDELVAQIDVKGFDIVDIRVTWLQGEQGWELNIEGYSVFRKDRQKGKGGGVALLIKDDVDTILRKDINIHDVESVWVEIRNNKGQKTLVGVVYRTPNYDGNVGKSIRQEIRDACVKGTSVIMEDFHLHIDWES